MEKVELLKLLADGKFHSGQELADSLGVSRTAVWKQLGNLDTLGLIAESVKGKGYRLPGGLQLLDRDRLLSHLSLEAQALLGEIQLPGIVDSTNSLALRHIADGGGKGFVCSAEQQTAGRGRRGRSWISPYGDNIYMSLVWEFDGGAAALEGLSLTVGVAIVEALETLGISELKLKWPNDILFNGKKLAGILLEMVGDAAGLCQVVIGLGVNVQMSAKMGREIDQAWTDIRSIPGGDWVERNQLQAALLNQLLPIVRDFQRQGFSDFRQRWLDRDAYAGQSVVLISGENRICGKAAGVDGHGALLLDTAAGMQTFNGGELSLRLSQ